jgi:hypothetical protein
VGGFLQPERPFVAAGKVLQGGVNYF